MNASERGAAGVVGDFDCVVVSPRRFVGTLSMSAERTESDVGRASSLLGVRAAMKSLGTFTGKIIVAVRSRDLDKNANRSQSLLATLSHKFSACHTL